MLQKESLSLRASTSSGADALTRVYKSLVKVINDHLTSIMLVCDIKKEHADNELSLVTRRGIDSRRRITNSVESKKIRSLSLTVHYCSVLWSTVEHRSASGKDAAED